MEKFKVT